jgi:hypothetical protein
LVDALEAADETDRFSLDWSSVRPYAEIPSRSARTKTGDRLRRQQFSALRTDPFFQHFVQSEVRLAHLAELEKRMP